MSEIVRVPFHGDEILTIDQGGKPHVILKPALEKLGVDYSAQYRRLQRRSWACVAMTATQLPGDNQVRQVVTVDVRTFLMLLATIDEQRVEPAVRPTLIAYQQEVADAIEKYWTKGGAINPRATQEQRDLIAAQILVTLAPIVGRDWAEAKARHLAARALGEEPDIDPATRPLTVGEYLADRGITATAQRSLAPKFGKELKGVYRRQRGGEPPAVERFVDGALRSVAGYTEADRDLFDEVYTRVLSRGGRYVH